MRDNGEPFDEITLSLRHDDIDKFQHIISMSNIDITKNVVPYNIFEDYVNNGKTSYLVCFPINILIFILMYN